MKLILLIVFFCVFIIALIFSVLNFHSVQINLGFTSISLPLTVALTIELFAGIVIGLLAALIQILRLKSDYAHLNKQLEKNK
ncbi:MAG: LapA family protein [Methylococcaceae bacterium]|nr:LapA family protein [Methylococcaceae bacterium]